jgi:hypothetical protein
LRGAECRTSERFSAVGSPLGQVSAPVVMDRRIHIMVISSSAAETVRTWHGRQQWHVDAAACSVLGAVKQWRKR